MKFNFKAAFPYIIAVIAIIAINCIYFLPQLSGKMVEQSDTVQGLGMSKEATDYNKSTGKQAFWTNSMFGGMPTYQIAGLTPSNKVSWLQKVITMGIDRPIGYFIAGMLGFFLLLTLLGMNPWLSLIGAIMFGLATNNLILFEAGHNSKVMTVFTAPYILAGMMLVFKKKYLIGGVLFSLGLSLNLYNNHPQMTYYLGLFIAIIALGFVIDILLKKEWVHLLKSLGIFTASLAIAFGTSASRIMTTLEYQEESMRGKPILALDTKGDQPSKSLKGGLEYDYAMAWSNTGMDVLASLVPLAAGGGSGEWLDKNSILAQKVGSRKDFQAPTYWGGLPGTSGPAYFGIVTFFLFFTYLFTSKNKIKWYLTAGIILSILISMGKNFPLLNEFLFNHLPYFNKFRAPSSALSVTVLFLALGAILGLDELLNTSEAEKPGLQKRTLWSSGIFIGLLALLYLMGSSLFSFQNEEADKNYANILDTLIEQRSDMYHHSLLVCIAFAGIAALLIFFFTKSKLSKNVVMIGLGIITLLDLFSIGKRYLDSKDFVSSKIYNNNFSPREVDNQILADKELDYRVYDATINTYNSATASYFHKTIGGYHPAKLQRYQDVIERHISKGNQNVLDMLNTKYFIIPGGKDAQSPPIVQVNNGRYGNAWFIDTIIVVKNANAEIDSLQNVNKDKAIIHEEFAASVANYQPVKNGEIKLDSYEPNKLGYSSNATSDQLAVFSEIWYGPNKGWTATIDGKPADILRANYILRALKVPAGQHKIVFEFIPQTFINGERISLVSSWSLILLILTTIGLGFYTKRSQA
jgi:hypothetical protein